MNNLFKIIFPLSIYVCLISCSLFLPENHETFSVSFNINGADNGSIPPGENDRRAGEVITLPRKGDLHKDNSYFFGWNTNPDGTGEHYNEGEEFVIRSFDITLYAIWKYNTFTIFFDKNAPDASGEMSSLKVHMNSTITLTRNIYKNDLYRFSSWNTSPDGTGISYYNGSSIHVGDRDFTLYAQWTDKYINIFFNKNSDTAIGEMEYLTVESMSNGYLSENLYVDDVLSFMGWNTKQDGSGQSYNDGGLVVTKDSDITLYAQWGYCISFDKNHSDLNGFTDVIYFIDNITVRIPDHSYENSSGKHFFGWNTEADGSGVTYMVGDELTLNSTSLMLYAIWPEDTVTDSNLIYTYNTDNNYYIVSSVNSSGMTNINIIEKIGAVPVGEITNRAFSYLTQLLTITLPNTIEVIGEDAFENCSNLTEIILPNKLKKIEDRAFIGCSSLSSIILPDSLLEIGSAAFASCTGLTSITLPENLNSLGGVAFRYCINLQSVYIPESLTSIGTATFNGCSSLTEISLPNSIKEIGDSAFEECSSLISITLPDYLAVIGSRAFSECSSLISINLPNGLTTLEWWLFEECTALEYVSIPNSVTSIGREVFRECYSLDNVIIPDSVLEIGQSSFARCTSLTTITLSNNLTTLSDSLFSLCTKLSDISIPESVSEIESRVFSRCSSLSSVDIPDNVEVINVATFLECYSLNNINLPEQLTRIESFVFFDCTSLTELHIPEGVEYIDRSFMGCNNLRDIYIYANEAPEIDALLFNNLNNITLHIKPSSIGYDVTPWIDHTVFTSVLTDI